MNPEMPRQIGHRELFKKAGVVSEAILLLFIPPCLRSQTVPANGWPGMKPTREVVVLSAPTGTGAGYFSTFDQSGDSLMVEESVGNNPLSFTLDSTGSYGSTINGDGSLTWFR